MNRLHGALIVFFISATVAYFTPNISNSGISRETAIGLSDQQLQIHEGLSDQKMQEMQDEQSKHTEKKRETMKRLRTEDHLNMHHARKN